MLWVLIGHTLAFGPDIGKVIGEGGWIGGLDFIGFKDVGAEAVRRGTQLTIPHSAVRDLPDDVRGHHAGAHRGYVRGAHQVHVVLGVHGAVGPRRLRTDGALGVGRRVPRTRRVSARSTSPAARWSTRTRVLQHSPPRSSWASARDIRRNRCCRTTCRSSCSVRRSCGSVGSGSTAVARSSADGFASLAFTNTHVAAGAAHARLVAAGVDRSTGSRRPSVPRPVPSPVWWRSHLLPGSSGRGRRSSSASSPASRLLLRGAAEAPLQLRRRTGRRRRALRRWTHRCDPDRCVRDEERDRSASAVSSTAVDSPDAEASSPRRVSQRRGASDSASSSSSSSTSRSACGSAKRTRKRDST